MPFNHERVKVFQQPIAMQEVKYRKFGSFAIDLRSPSSPGRGLGNEGPFARPNNTQFQGRHIAYIAAHRPREVADSRLALGQAEEVAHRRQP
jgi:hypothetical protein